MIQHRPGPQSVEWLRHPYTQYLHKQALQHVADTLAWLIDECASSQDPDVRAALTRHLEAKQNMKLFEYKEPKEAT